MATSFQPIALSVRASAGAWYRSGGQTRLNHGYFILFVKSSLVAPYPSIGTLCTSAFIPVMRVVDE